MSKAVILSRSFNAFISMTVSVWSVGFIVIPLLLNAIIASFFGFVAVVPLLAICIIAGAIALGVGLWSGYSRYCHLTREAKEIASKYRLQVETALDLDEISKKSPHIITLVLEENKAPVAYFKLADNEACSLDLGGLSRQKQAVLLEINQKKVTTEQEKRLINKIIQRVLSNQDQNTYPKPNPADPEETSRKGEQSLLLWEKINAFFCDAPTIFALALIIIFLTTHVFAGALIPSALLIAAIVSIAYGLFSALIKDKQSDAKLRAMNLLKNSYNHVVGMAQDLIKEVNERFDQVGELKKLAVEIDPEGHQPYQSIIQKPANDLATVRAKVSSPQGQLEGIKREAHLEFSNKEIWRLVYAFIGGGITLGSCIYVVLPQLLIVLGFSPLSLPVLVVIIAVASIVYGLLNLYNKKQMIEREGWNKMDNNAIEKIREGIEQGKTAESTERKSIRSDLDDIDSELSRIRMELQGKKEVIEKKTAVEQPNVQDYTDSKLWQLYSLLAGSRRPERQGGSPSSFWTSTASTVNTSSSNQYAKPLPPKTDDSDSTDSGNLLTSSSL